MGVSVEGTVLELLPRGLYRVGIERQRAHRQAQGGLSSSKAEVIAHAPGGPGRNFIRVLVGDRVRLELSPRDVARGRIVEKLK
jgi:translation initiation factor IF-1